MQLRQQSRWNDTILRTFLGTYQRNAGIFFFQICDIFVGQSEYNIFISFIDVVKVTDMSQYYLCFMLAPKIMLPLV